MPNDAQQQEQVQAWCKKLGLVDPNPAVLAAIGARVESICALRKQQHQLVSKLFEISGTPTKAIYTWLQTYDNKWTCDLARSPASIRPAGSCSALRFGSRFTVCSAWREPGCSRSTFIARRSRRPPISEALLRRRWLLRIIARVWYRLRS